MITIGADFIASRRLRLKKVYDLFALTFNGTKSLRILSFCKENKKCAIRIAFQKCWLLVRFNLLVWQLFWLYVSGTKLFESIDANF